METGQDNIILVILTLVVGAALGIGASILTSRLEQRQAVSAMFIDRYFSMRKDVVAVISKLANVDLRTKMAADDVGKYQKELSKAAFQHYDFLPKELLEAMLLLYIALGSTIGNLYKFKGSGVVAIRDDGEILRFIKGAYLFSNAGSYAPSLYKSKNPTIRRNVAIRTHANHVLMVLNRYASVKNILGVTKVLVKKGEPGKHLPLGTYKESTGNGSADLDSVREDYKDLRF